LRGEQIATETLYACVFSNNTARAKLTDIYLKEK